MSVFLPALRLSPRLGAFMDNLLAIGLGILVRNVIHLVSRGDNKITGTLVGMWEGIVLSHFLRKMPNSLDPLLGYAVRLFIDWFLTENVTRLVLVVVWTGLGVVLADITPSLWVDVGLHRFWRRFRRDLYYMARSMPQVDIFPRARTVRFSPPNAAAVLTGTDTTVTPSVVSAARPSTAPQPPLTARPTSKRHVPGSFESDADTITEASSVRSRQRELPALRSQTRRRQTIFPAFTTVFRDNMSEVTSAGHDVDEGNISSPVSEGRSEDFSAANPNEIPDELELEYVDTKPERPVAEGTPKQRNIGLPTPTDSTHPFDPMRHEDDHVRPPPPADILTIPDNYDDWEKIAKVDAENAPPPVPKKDTKQQPSAPSPSQPVPPPNIQPKGHAATTTQPQLPPSIKAGQAQQDVPTENAAPVKDSQAQNNVPSDNTLPIRDTQARKNVPVPPDNGTSIRDSTMSEKPPAYQDVYDEQKITVPLTEKPPVSVADTEVPPDDAQNEADTGAQAKSENADGVENKSVASDLSEETLNSLEGLTCLQQMARLHQLIAKAKKDYGSAEQRHKSVRTAGNKGMANKAKTEMDASERRLKKLTNKAEACYLTHNQPDRKFAEEVDLSSFKTRPDWEEQVQKILEQFLRPSVEKNSLRFVSLKGKQGLPQKDYITNLLRSLELNSRADPSNGRVTIADK